MKPITVILVSLLIGFSALAIRDSCDNSNFSGYGNVSDCPAQK